MGASNSRLVVATLLVGAVGAAVALQLSSSDPVVKRVAFLGNSLLYFNDVPRLMEALCGDKGLVHDCCLRGGANFKSLLKEGSRNPFAEPKGCATVAALLQNPWDVVVLQDFTQGPAREESRRESVATLVEAYAPLVARCNAVPVLLATHAYREHTKGSDDLGDVREFTRRLREGYEAYAEALADALPTALRPRVAPSGMAFEVVHAERPALWRELFHIDDFHLSPSGSFLEATVLHWTIFGEAPPVFNKSPPQDPATLFREARFMQPPKDPVQPMPSAEDAEYLLDVAARVVAAASG